MRAILLLVCVLSVGLALGGLGGGCAPSRAERVEAALLSDEPPADFWLAVTVLRPVPLGAIINAKTEPDRSSVPRPARYVVEADMVLRAAVGYGASEETFPPETRQLTSAQVAGLWRMLRGSGLVDPDHPSRTGKLPTLDEFAVQTEGRGGYCVSFSIEGERRIVVIDEAKPAAADARMLVEKLAALAWIVPKPGDAKPDAVRTDAPKAEAVGTEAAQTEPATKTETTEPAKTEPVP